MRSGRVKKTKPKRRSNYEAEEPELAGPSSKSDKWKKSGRRKSDLDENAPSRAMQQLCDETNRDFFSQLDAETAGKKAVADDLFASWEDLLGSREELQRRLQSIAAVHGWESRSSRRSFLGGVEPAAVVRWIRDEIGDVDAAAEELGRADLLLQLREERERLDALADEKGRLHDLSLIHI